ncbi:MAG: hypothetical protein ACJ761_10445 [Chloroflexota bacterium]
MSATARALEELAVTALGLSRLSGEVRVVGLGWATVELDRAARWLASELPGSGPFEPGSGDELLAASCRIGPSGLGAAPWLVLLEPDKEGRLAALLARRGEGPIAAWIVPENGFESAGRMSAGGDGPFGPQRLILGGAAGDPQVLVVERSAGTIGR